MLAQLGFDAFFAEQMSSLDDALAPARVVAAHRRQWDVASEAGTERAVLAGKSWAQAGVTQLDDAQPAVGDWVALARPDGASTPVIVKTLTRRTEMARTSIARRGVRQTLVANIDLVFIVAAFARADAQESAAKRSLHARRLERYIAAVKKGGARPLVVINKADLVQDASQQARRLQGRLGVPVLAMSCVEGEPLDALTMHVEPGQSIGLVGLSGVGKSSIVNRILRRDAQKVSSERQADTRGRHTTTHRELFLAEEGFCLIDTPGMREFALADPNEEDLLAFDDITELAGACQFRDCRHESEPGCAVLAAVASGKLDRDRLRSYHTLLTELTSTDLPRQRRELVRKPRVARKGRRERWDDHDS